MKPLHEINGEAILDALRKSPEVKTHLVNEAKRVAQERERLAAELEALNTQAGNSFATTTAAIEVARRARDDARAVLMHAERTLTSAVAARVSACHQFDQKRQAIRAALVESASPAIDEFLAKMHDELDRTMKTPAEIETGRVKDLVTGARRANTRTGAVVHPSERLRGIRATLVAVGEMVFDADQAAVPERLAKLEAELPVIGAPK